MIMSVLFNILTIIMAIFLIKGSNPVKMSLILLVISSMLFLKMYQSSGQCWYPLLFFLIFMGGILMMFMILSSILPNEKSKKTKKITIIIPFLVSVYFINMDTEIYDGVSGMNKSILDSSSSMGSMMIIMLSYFFITISMISKENSPMRNLLCYKLINFVN